MENSDLAFSYHADLRKKQRNISNTSVAGALSTGNKVNFGLNDTVVCYSKDCKVVASNDCIISVASNSRNSRFDILRNSRKSLESLKYQIEIKNNDHAMCELGQIYLDGLLTEKNVKKAYELFQRASARGNSHAMCKLSDICKSGELGKSDPALSEEWMLKAAEHGNTYALAVVGQDLLLPFINSNKTPCPETKQKIYYYLEKSASKGSTRALWTLGDIYNRGLLGDTDKSKAIEIFILAAKSGSPASVESLYTLCLESSFSSEKLEDILNYLVGYLSKSSVGMLVEMGIEQVFGKLGFNPTRGLKMIEAAVLSLKSNETALVNLIKCYKYGKGCDANMRLCQYWYNELYSLYEVSSEEGNVQSLWNMGKIHLKGYVGEIDLDKAENFFKEAVSLSKSPDYKLKLGELYYAGKLGDKDITIGKKLIHEALVLKQEKALMNNYIECYNLGVFYTNWIYDFASYEKSHYWLSKAALGGIKKAELALAEIYLNKNSGYTNLGKALQIVEELILSKQLDFMVCTNVLGNLTLKDLEFHKWLKVNAGLEPKESVESQVLYEKHENRIKMLKHFSLLTLQNGYISGILDEEKDYQLIARLAFNLFEEFGSEKSIEFIITHYKKDLLSSESDNAVKDWCLKLPCLLMTSSTFKKFDFYCRMLSTLYDKGNLLPKCQIECAKYICLMKLCFIRADHVLSENILSKIEDDVAEKLKESGCVLVLLEELEDAFRASNLHIFKVVSRALGHLFYGGFLEKQDVDKAIAHYSEASRLNCPRSSLLLARIYQSDLKKNLYRALKYYKLAVKQGGWISKKELGCFIEKNPMFKTHLSFLDNYNFISSIPQHLILQTPPFKQLSEFPCDSFDIYKLAMENLKHNEKTEQRVQDAAFWLRNSSKDGIFESHVELYIMYKSGLLGSNVISFASIIKIRIYKWLYKFCASKNVKKFDDDTIINQIKDFSEALRKISDEPDIRKILELLDKCFSSQGIITNHLNEVRTACEEVIKVGTAHMSVKVGYSCD